MRWRAMIVVVVMLGGTVPTPAQGPQLSRLMRQKLQHSQAILQALVTSNWTLLEAQTRELERLTEDPRWMVLKSPEYSTQSAAFVTALQRLRAVSNERESAKATEAYATVVSRCVDCHRYVARARIAR